MPCEIDYGCMSHEEAIELYFGNWEEWRWEQFLVEYEGNWNENERDIWVVDWETFDWETIFYNEHYDEAGIYWDCDDNGWCFNEGPEGQSCEIDYGCMSMEEAIELYFYSWEQWRWDEFLANYLGDIPEDEWYRDVWVVDWENFDWSTIFYNEHYDSAGTYWDCDDEGWCWN